MRTKAGDIVDDNNTEVRIDSAISRTNKDKLYGNKGIGGTAAHHHQLIGTLNELRKKF